MRDPSRNGPIHPLSPDGRNSVWWAKAGMPHPDSPAGQTINWDAMDLPHPGSPAGQFLNYSWEFPRKVENAATNASGTGHFTYAIPAISGATPATFPPQAGANTATPAEPNIVVSFERDVSKGTARYTDCK